MYQCCDVSAAHFWWQQTARDKGCRPYAPLLQRFRYINAPLPVRYAMCTYTVRSLQGGASV
jgi:hypothetical protein